MQPLIDLTLCDQYTTEGPNLLNNGDFELGPGPVNWTPGWQCTASQQAGTRTGGSGSFVAQAAYNGVNPAGCLYQNGWGVAGRTAILRVWTKSVDGVSLPSAGQDYTVPDWTATVSPVVWVPVTVQRVWTAANVNLGCSNFAAGRAVQFDDASINYVISQTRNIGSLGGSVQLGDGSTPSKMPVRLTDGRRGFSFSQASRQYMLKTTPYDLGTQDFTFFMVISCHSPLDGAAVTNYNLLSNYNSPTSGWVWRISNGNAGVAGGLDWTACSGGNFPLDSAAHAIKSYLVHSVAITKRGNVVTMYVDGVIVAGPTAVTVPVAYQNQIGIGGADGNVQNFNGNIYVSRQYAVASTPTQILDMHYNAMSRLVLY